MKIVGVSSSVLCVVSEIFKEYDTLGLPLSEILCILKRNNMIPCWLSFYREATMAGWKRKTILNLIKEGITDSFIYSTLEIAHIMSRIEEETK